MAELTPVGAGYATPAQGAGPMIVTLKAGLFEKHGLCVEARPMGSAKGVVAGLMAGELQFGNLAAPSMLRSVLTEGADVVYLALGINQQFLVTRPGLTTRSALAGARLGFVGDGALSDVLALFLQEKLAKEGIPGLRLVPISNREEDRPAVLLDGTCDAVVLTPPTAIKANRIGCPLLIDLAEYGLNYALGGIAARRRYLEEHEDTARRFVAAYVEGLHRYRTDRVFTVEVQQEFSGLADRSLAEETYDITMPGMPRVPYPITSGLAQALQVMARDLPAAAGADPRQFVDDRFVRELDESGLIASLYAQAP